MFACVCIYVESQFACSLAGMLHVNSKLYEKSHTEDDDSVVQSINICFYPTNHVTSVAADLVLKGADLPTLNLA